MKIINKILTLLSVSAFVFIFPLSVGASDINVAVDTGDHGIIGIIIALTALIATAFITTRLTKNKNKKFKK